MTNFLIVEPSKTLRRGLTTYFSKESISESKNSVFQCDTFQLAIDALTENNNKFQCVIIGWPIKTDDIADELFSFLTTAIFKNIVLIILVQQESLSSISDWSTQREYSEVLLWNDYKKIIPVFEHLQSKIKPPSNLPQQKYTLSDQSIIRILLVDDSPTIRVSIRKLLTGRGYEVETASCVVEGYELAKSSQFDIAIIDYYMPGQNGDSLCRQLRQDPTTEHISSIILTGTYVDQIITDSLNSGALDCMFKNESEELFLTRIAALSRSIIYHKTNDIERKRLDGILNSVGDGVYGVNDTGYITFMNPAGISMLGFDKITDVIDKDAHQLFHYATAEGKELQREKHPLYDAYYHARKINNLELIFWHNHNKTIPVECTVYPLNIEGKFRGSVVAFRDITQRKLLEDELRWLATHDPLTKLLNRHYFETQLEEEVTLLNRHSERLSALLYLDLDRFKYINDTLGHIVGDELLVQIGHQLLMRLRKSDLLARLGGDEFAIILRDICRENVLEVADTFREVINNFRFEHNAKEYVINGTIGIALIDGNTESSGDVLSNADIACSIAKSKGRNQSHLYSDAENDMSAIIDMDLGWSVRLKDALLNDSFRLLYQPIVRINDLREFDFPENNGDLWAAFIDKYKGPIHYEVLIRMLDKKGHLISPHAFLPTAERFNMMKDIDRWVLKNAFQQLQKSNREQEQCHFSINLSAQSLMDKSLSQWIKDQVQSLGLCPSCINLEITETSAIANIEMAKNFINDLKEFGLLFSLDDFGSGFCSFSHIKHLPVDHIKIDGLFIQGFSSDPMDDAIVNSINKIAHSMGKETVAEFVESKNILKQMQTIHIDYAQGYYIQKPLEKLPERWVMN